MRTIAVMIVLGLLSACTSLPAMNCKAHEQFEVQDTMYFGAGSSNGIVTDAEWSNFLAATITPRFPQGLTVLDASGQWQNANGSLEHEATHILQIVHPNDDRNDKLIAEIISAYTTQFKQESVLRVTVNACISF
jgi:hypothetical protein